MKYLDKDQHHFKDVIYYKDALTYDYCYITRFNINVNTISADALILSDELVIFDINEETKEHLQLLDSFIDVLEG